MCVHCCDCMDNAIQFLESVILERSKKKGFQCVSFLLVSKEDRFTWWWKTKCLLTENKLEKQHFVLFLGNYKEGMLASTMVFSQLHCFFAFLRNKAKFLWKPFSTLLNTIGGLLNREIELILICLSNLAKLSMKPTIFTQLLAFSCYYY